LYEIPSQLHHVLRHYKTKQYPDLHDRFGAQVASLLSYFLTTNGNCIEHAAGGKWDVITTVPSSGDRGGRHPLVTAINRVSGLRDQYEPLLKRGSATISHLAASDDGYEVTRPLDGERILLVDDTFTSGSRAQSAASRLSLDGGDVVAIVPLGRVINPAFSETVSEYWKQRRKTPFTFDTCCLETEQEDEEPW
jgi:adenine/guanine phosphoribosyltransferase-like PRPP-binding protein